MVTVGLIRTQNGQWKACQKVPLQTQIWIAEPTKPKLLRRPEMEL